MSAVMKAVLMLAVAYDSRHITWLLPLSVSRQEQ